MNRKLLALLPVFALLLSFYTSCTRVTDTTDIGNDLIPVVDNVNTFDTILDVETDNLLFDDTSRVLADEDHAVGLIQNDPIFGSLKASIYVSLSPATFTFPFINRDSIKQVDSVVLSLAYTGIYGDSMSNQTFGVFELQNDPRWKDSANGFRISHPGINLGALLGNHSQDFFKLNDRYVINKGKDTQVVVNQMRMRIDNSLGQRLINADTSVYRNDTTFTTAFPGFAVLPQSGNQVALAYFNLANIENTKLTVYYKAKSWGGVADSSLVTNFTFRNFRNLNKIERTITGSEFANALTAGSPSDDKVYIASSPGSYASIKIKGLQELSNRVIHRVELVATPITPANDKYQAPYYLFLDAYDSTFKLPRTIQNDFTFNSTTGQYNQTLFGGFLVNGKYTFDISRYVQGIVTRKEKSYTLRLFAPYKTASVYVPGGFASAYNLTTLDSDQKRTGGLLYLNPLISYGRTVLGGGTHPTSKMRLRIIYSKI